MRFFPALWLLLALAAGAEDPLPADVQKNVHDYLAAKDADAKKMEAGFKSIPFDVLSRSVAADTWGDAVKDGEGEFEIEVPNDGAKTTVAYFVPPGYTPDRAWPMLLGVHGTDGHAVEERARWEQLAQAKDAGFLVVCPEEQKKLWGQGWGSRELERALTLAALAQATRRFHVDPDRVFLAGVSRGGHATWEVGLLFGDRFAGLYANAGGLRIVNFGYVHNLGAVPLLESLGGKDQEMLVADVKSAVDAIQKDGGEVVFHLHEEAGHGVGYGDDPEFGGWIEKRRRDGYPKRFVHAFSRINQGRAYWVQATKIPNGVLDPTTKQPSIELPPGKKPSEAEMRELFKQKLAEGEARIEAKVEGNKIEITTQKVTEIVVWFSSQVVDLSQPVEVWVNGMRKYQAKVEPDGVKMLQHVRETGDRGRVFENSFKTATK